MCKVSGKLKLCTCKTQNVESLKHYWVLHKFHKSEFEIMGLPVLPQGFEIGHETDRNNGDSLQAMLNEGNCFDVELQIDNKDILELHLSCTLKSDNKNEVHLVYEFEYKKGKWRKTSFDPFNTDKLQKDQGKIVNPFVKT